MVRWPHSLALLLQGLALTSVLGADPPAPETSPASAVEAGCQQFLAEVKKAEGTILQSFNPGCLVVLGKQPVHFQGQLLWQADNGSIGETSPVLDASWAMGAAVLDAGARLEVVGLQLQNVVLPSKQLMITGLTLPGPLLFQLYPLTLPTNGSRGPVAPASVQAAVAAGTSLSLRDCSLATSCGMLSSYVDWLQEQSSSNTTTLQFSVQNFEDGSFQVHMQQLSYGSLLHMANTTISCSTNTSVGPVVATVSDAQQLAAAMTLLSQLPLPSVIRIQADLIQIPPNWPTGIVLSQDMTLQGTGDSWESWPVVDLGLLPNLLTITNRAVLRLNSLSLINLCKGLYMPDSVNLPGTIFGITYQWWNVNMNRNVLGMIFNNTLVVSPQEDIDVLAGGLVLATIGDTWARFAQLSRIVGSRLFRDELPPVVNETALLQARSIGVSRSYFNSILTSLAPPRMAALVREPTFCSFDPSTSTTADRALLYEARSADDLWGVLQEATRLSSSPKEVASTQVVPFQITIYRDIPEIGSGFKALQLSTGGSPLSIGLTWLLTGPSYPRDPDTQLVPKPTLSLLDCVGCIPVVANNRSQLYIQNLRFTGLMGHNEGLTTENPGAVAAGDGLALPLWAFDFDRRFNLVHLHNCTLELPQNEFGLIRSLAELYLRGLSVADATSLLLPPLPDAAFNSSSGDSGSSNSSSNSSSGVSGSSNSSSNSSSGDNGSSNSTAGGDEALLALLRAQHMPALAALEASMQALQVASASADHVALTYFAAYGINGSQIELVPLGGDLTDGVPPPAPPSPPPPPPGNGTDTDSSSGGLSGGALAGIIMGCVLALAGLIGLAWRAIAKTCSAQIAKAAVASSTNKAGSRRSSTSGLHSGRGPASGGNGGHARPSSVPGGPGSVSPQGNVSVQVGSVCGEPASRDGFMMGQQHMMMEEGLKSSSTKSLMATTTTAKSVAAPSSRPSSRMGGQDKPASGVPRSVGGGPVSHTSNTSLSSMAADPIDEVKQMIADLGGDKDDNKLIIKECIGKGGYGTVHRGVWCNMEVAVKMMLFTNSSPFAGNKDMQLKQRAVREAAVCSSVNHANVVATYHYDIMPVHSVGPSKGVKGMQIKDLSTVDYKLYLVQEFCEYNLTSVLDSGMLHEEDRTPRVEVLLAVLLDVTYGMVYLHSRNIVHGDLTPSNILIKMRGADGSFTAKITDFGLCELLEAGKTHISNYRVGTPFYMAPEVTTNNKLTKASDIYTFGILMVELYTRAAPYITLEGGGFVRNRDFGRKGFDRTGKRGPLLPDYQRLAARCMAKDPSQRPSFPELLHLLRLMARGWIMPGHPQEASAGQCQQSHSHHGASGGTPQASTPMPPQPAPAALGGLAEVPEQQPLEAEDPPHMPIVEKDVDEMEETSPEDVGVILARMAAVATAAVPRTQDLPVQVVFSQNQKLPPSAREMAQQMEEEEGVSV